MGEPRLTFDILNGKLTVLPGRPSVSIPAPAQGVEEDGGDAPAADEADDIAVDHPVRAILAVAERWQATVVVGRTGRGWLQELALGSTAHELARRSPVPVLVDGENTADGV